MDMRNLPDMYAQRQRDEGIHIRQIMNAHVTRVMCLFVMVTPPVCRLNATSMWGCKYKLLMHYNQEVQLVTICI